MRIVLAGDSTVTDDAGWGQGFAARLAPGATCVNLSQGGRSSKSYRDEGFWDQVLETRADLVLIQFGHNDQPGKGPERETDPDTTYHANLTRYVAEARVTGIRPILVTSLTRRWFGPNGRLQETLGPYASATIRVASEQDVVVLDLHTASMNLCEKIGEAECLAISYPSEDGNDRTHLNASGGTLFGSLVADLLWEATPELRLYLTKPLS